MSCGVRTCYNLIRQDGVCGKHLKYRYLTEDKKVLDGMEEYRKVFEEYIEEANRLEASGYNVLEVQAYHDNNLCGPLVHTIPQHLEKVKGLLDKQKLLIEAMQGKHDSILISNMTVRICHSYGPKCDCSYCSLK